MFDGAEFNPEPDSDEIRALRRARDLLARPNGWCQHKEARLLPDGTGFAYCALGAIRAAVDYIGLGPLAYLPRKGLSLRMCGYLADDPHALMGWNDCAGRTQAEVVAAFDRGIERAIDEARARAKVKEMIHV